MIAGVGTDLCSIARIEHACQSEKFRHRVFVEEELDYASGKPTYFAHLAACFAAREAFAKATGIGLSCLGLKSVYVSHADCGRPVLKLDADAMQLKPFLSGRFHLSLSHEAGMALAFIIYEEEA